MRSQFGDQFAQVEATGETTNSSGALHHQHHRVTLPLSPAPSHRGLPGAPSSSGDLEQNTNASGSTTRTSLLRQETQENSRKQKKHAMILGDNDGSRSVTRAAPLFTWQRLTLDAAVSPLLPRPIIPGIAVHSAPSHTKKKKAERKRAYLAANYYSECFLNGIAPVDAEKAALDAQARYERWWVESKKGSQDNQADDLGREPGQEKRKRLDLERSVNDPSATHHDNVTLPSSKKRRAGAETPAASSLMNLADEVQLLTQYRAHEVAKARSSLLEDLQLSGGDTTTERFQTCLTMLQASFASRGYDVRWSASNCTDDASATLNNCGTRSSTSMKTTAAKCGAKSIDGTWLALSKPTYAECQGRSNRGEYQYSLGRMSFDMFRPTGLLCSIQGIYNTIRPRRSSSSLLASSGLASFPSSLRKDLQHPQSELVVRNYDIVVSFTIEAGQDLRGNVLAAPDAAAATAVRSLPSDTYITPRPIRGLLTNHGYCVPDPHVANRLTIWFSGGSLEVQDEEADLNEWNHVFQEPPNRDMRQYARVLAARVLLGAHGPSGPAPEDGTLSYELKRPIGGHGQVYCDVIYEDESLRVMRGHHGTIYVFSRMPTFTSEE